MLNLFDIKKHVVPILFGLSIIMIGFLVFSAYNSFFKSDSNSTSTSNGTNNQQSELQKYINTEYGFEFEYPENWKLEENSFYSPFSKFNLQGDSSAENYNPFSPSFIVNIVTPDFADRAVVSFRNMNARTSIVIIAGTQGIKYEYEFESVPRIAIDLPFSEYRMLLGADRAQEDIFNQTLASFKFLK